MIMGLKQGDLVEIRRITNYRGEIWLPAIVLTVTAKKFLCRLVRGSFGVSAMPEGNECWFPLDQKGHMWR
jgi:hypothetical protein